MKLQDLKQPFHRLRSPTQTPDDDAKIEASGELWGRAPWWSDIPTVQAYIDALPDHEEGIEFRTPAQGDLNPLSGEVRFRRGNAGVSVKTYGQDDFAVISVIVTKRR